MPPTYQVLKTKGVEDEAEKSSSHHNLLDNSIDALVEKDSMNDGDLSDQDEISSNLHPSNDEKFSKTEDALCLFRYGESRTAIEQVVIPKGEAVELLPWSSNLFPLQKNLIRKCKLKSERVGAESHVLLRILPFQSTTNRDEHPGKELDADDEFDELFKPETNGSPYTVDRLPILADNCIRLLEMSKDLHI